ncbi:MAG: 30S ribosomal protein S2 [Candidatus Pacebacteria bacterium]|nr:30S ribosomal protein S2 [Candidatus Paceibacterota bacterium]
MSINTDNLIKLGAHYGYSKSRRHPSTKKQIIISKSGNDFIDLDSTSVQLFNALASMKKIIEAKGQILFIGTKPEARSAVREIALALNMPYITERYIGGSITNFSEIRKRVDVLGSLLKQKEDGSLDVYTKKERVLIQKKTDKLDKNFGGLSLANGMPKAIFVIDSKKEYIAVDEANKLSLPIFALCNTDCDINKIDFPIMCNEASSGVIREVLEYIKDNLR